MILTRDVTNTLDGKAAGSIRPAAEFSDSDASTRLARVPKPHG